MHGRLDVNVALNRPTYTSSIYSNWYGWYGNDGEKTYCDTRLPGYKLTASRIELNPWYVVDLGVKVAIAGVNLTHRGDHIPSTCPTNYTFTHLLCKRNESSKFQ